MELNAAQHKFIEDLRQMLPLYFKGNDDARLKTPVTNVEWNVKKLTGEFQGDALDGATFAQRTKADLELIAAALPAGAAGQAYAARSAEEVMTIFSAAPATASDPSAVAPADSTSSNPAASSSPTVATTVDAKALLEEKAAHAGEKLAWKTSVVDLLKLLGKDSSQGARHRYAVALGFPESEIGKMPSVEFNTWLHGQLLASLASNGGNLPANIA